MNTTVTQVNQYGITFSDGTVMRSEHDQDCCEHHELSFDDLTMSDFEGLEFDLSNEDSFLERVEDFGIRLKPVKGHSVSIPGHGYNNGYYGTNITLILTKDNHASRYDVSECQVIIDC